MTLEFASACAENASAVARFAPATRVLVGHPPDVVTAISIPDDVFEDTERLARAGRRAIERTEWGSPKAWTGGPTRARVTGNDRVEAAATKLANDSVAHASRVVALDRGALHGRAGRLARRDLGLVPSGVDLVVGRGRAGAWPPTPFTDRVRHRLG